MNRLTHWVDRALPLLVGTTLILGALLVWARTWELSCWALLAPGVASAAIAYGSFQHRWHRKRSVIEYYLADDGELRSCLKRSWLTPVDERNRRVIARSVPGCLRGPLASIRLGVPSGGGCGGTPVLRPLSVPSS